MSKDDPTFEVAVTEFVSKPPDRPCACGKKIEGMWIEIEGLPYCSAACINLEPEE